MGAPRLRKVDCTWRPDLAYIIGLIASDGNLSIDGRHIALTSKDFEIVEISRNVLGLSSKIGRKARGGETEKKYYVLQFSDIHFYTFLESIGLTPAKSKTIGPLDIPDAFFRDFLRGCIDGDGNIGAFLHPESQHIQVRLSLISASLLFLVWVRETIHRLYDIQGGSFWTDKKKSVTALRFGSRDSMELFKIMYYDAAVPALSRKRIAAEQLAQGRVAKLV